VAIPKVPRGYALMITLSDSDILMELTDQLADDMLLLHSAHLRLPDNEKALKERMEEAIREIAALRMKVLKLIFDDIVKAVFDGDPP
jgi:hypothetical protein